MMSHLWEKEYVADLLCPHYVYSPAIHIASCVLLYVRTLDLCRLKEIV